MKFFLGLLLLTFSATGRGECSLSTFHRILLVETSSIADLKNNIIKESNCSAQKQWLFANLIAQSGGQLPANYVKRKIGITNLAPASIQISWLKETLEEKLFPDSKGKRRLRKLTPLRPVAALTLGPDDQLSLSPRQEDWASGSEKRIQIIIATANGKKNGIWLKAESEYLIKAYVAQKHLAAFNSKLKEDFFSRKAIWVKSPSQYVQEDRPFGFFKLTQALSKGEPLRRSALTAVVLVRPGRNVEMTFVNEKISVKAFGQARQTGHYGDIIEVQNRKTKKSISGQVVDFNKIKVQL